MTGTGDQRLLVPRSYLPYRHGQLHLRRVGPFASGAGPGSKRPPLVLFHQVPNSGQVFERFMPMVAAERRVIAIDTPGFGMSDPVPDPQTIEAYAAAMAEALHQLGHASIDVLGYHTGAAIAAALALLKPGLIRRLMLVAVPVLTAEERAASLKTPPIPFDAEGKFVRAEWQRSVSWKGAGQDWESLSRGFAEKMRVNARAIGAKAVMAFDMAAALEAVSRQDLPLAIIRPYDDLWEATARARAHCEPAQWHDLPDYGHGLFDAAPGLMAGLAEGFFQA